MAREKMAELKIKVPAHWLNFINELYEIADMDRDGELAGWIKSGLECDIEGLSAEDRVRLVEKHKVDDIYEIPQWVRDRAAEFSSSSTTEKKTKLLTRGGEIFV